MEYLVTCHCYIVVVVVVVVYISQFLVYGISAYKNIYNKAKWNKIKSHKYKLYTKHISS